MKVEISFPEVDLEVLDLLIRCLVRTVLLRQNVAGRAMQGRDKGQGSSVGIPGLCQLSIQTPSAIYFHLGLDNATSFAYDVRIATSSLPR